MAAPCKYLHVMRPLRRSGASRPYRIALKGKRQAACGIIYGIYRLCADEVVWGDAMPRDLPLANGRMLVNFDFDYNVRDVYWPHVGERNQTQGHVNHVGVW